MMLRMNSVALLVIIVARISCIKKCSYFDQTVKYDTGLKLQDPKKAV